MRKSLTGRKAAWPHKEVLALLVHQGQEEGELLIFHPSFGFVLNNSLFSDLFEAYQSWPYCPPVSSEFLRWAPAIREPIADNMKEMGRWLYLYLSWNPIQQ